MYLYLIDIILSVIFLLFLWKDRETDRRLQIVLTAATAVFLGIRFSIGNDTGVYHLIYERATANPFSDFGKTHIQRDLTYNVLTSLVKYTLHDFRWLVLVENIIFWVILLSVIFHESRNRILSLLLTVGSGVIAVYYTSGIRQMLAMSFFLLGFYAFLKKKKYIPYEICCLLAFGCHEAALFTFFLPLLQKAVPHFQKNTKKTVLICTAVSFGIFLLIRFGGTALAGFVFDHFGDGPSTHAFYYLFQQQPSFLGTAMELVFEAGLLILISNADQTQLNEWDWLEIVVFFSSIFFYFAFSSYSIMSRVSDFYQYIGIILIPKLLSITPSHKKRMLSAGALVLLNGFLLYSDVSAACRSLSNMSQREITASSYPYVTVFEKDKVETAMQAFHIDTKD